MLTNAGLASSNCPSGVLKYTPSCNVSNNSVKRSSFSRCSVTSRPRRLAPDNLVTLHDSIQHAIKIKRPRAVLQPQPRCSRPALFLQKSSQTAFHIFARRLVDKVVNLPVHQFGVRQSSQFGNALIHRSQCSVKRQRARRFIKGVDQLLETPLRPHDDLAQLVELFFRRRRAHVLLQSTQEPLEFADFASSSIGINREQDR